MYYNNVFDPIKSYIRKLYLTTKFQDKIINPNLLTLTLIIYPKVVNS